LFNYPAKFVFGKPHCPAVVHPKNDFAAVVCAAAVEAKRGAGKSAAGGFRESGFGQGIVKGNDRIQLRGQRLQ
jgi:hypothetical protein